MTRTAIEVAIRSRELVSLAPGYYLPAGEVGVFPENQHLALARAVIADRGGHDALARVSAAVNLDLPVGGAALSRVHLARPGGTGSGSRTTTVTVVHRNIAEEDVIVVRGVRSTSVARTVVDLARSESVRTATVTADAALHRKLCDVEDLRSVLNGMGAVDGCARARRLITGVDRRAESPLESLSRLAIVGSCLPAPDLQREIIDDSGRLIARVDFFWEEFGVVGECDGMGKYFGQYSDKSLREVLDEEKFRAQELQDLGYVVVRWTWHELLHRPDVVIERIRRAIERARH